MPLRVAMVCLTVMMVAGCTPPLVQEVHQVCTNASDVTACENAEYARRYAIERERNRHYYP